MLRFQCCLAKGHRPSTQSGIPRYVNTIMMNKVMMHECAPLCFRPLPQTKMAASYARRPQISLIVVKTFSPTAQSSWLSGGRLCWSEYAFVDRDQLSVSFLGSVLELVIAPSILAHQQHLLRV